MPKINHPIDLLPGYAIGSLSEPERAEIAAHLHTCASCRKALAGYEAAVAQLSLATPTRFVPDRVKKRLMAKVDQQHRGATRISAQPWWKSVFAKPAYAAISLVAILALAASNVWLWTELRQRDEAAARVAETVPLANTGKAASGTAMLIISEDGQHATLIVEQLPQLSLEQQYQLWLIADGQPVSAGVFTVSPDGYYALPVFSQVAFDTYSAFGVSVEPFGGSTAPTGDIVLYQERGA